MHGEYRKNASHVFVHVPKTGGGSANVYLRECSAIAVPFGAHALTVAMVLAVNRSAIIALRDPADRVISDYQWNAQDLGKDYNDGVRRSHIKASCDNEASRTLVCPILHCREGELSISLFASGRGHGASWHALERLPSLGPACARTFLP